MYFVSGNTRDFGDAATRPQLLDDDLTGLTDRFVHLTSIDEVAQQFALPVHPDTDWYTNALSQYSLRDLTGPGAITREDDTSATTLSPLPPW
ncbi:hypothetical protein ACQB60_44775 [Actinomycetota bacterium Odt1-20B]